MFEWIDDDRMKVPKRVAPTSALQNAADYSRHAGQEATPLRTATCTPPHLAPIAPCLAPTPTIQCS